MGSLYSQKARANKELEVLVIPERAIADATAAKEVGKGNLCRIQGIADEFVIFGDSAVVVPTVTTKETIQTEAGFFIVTAPADFIRTSVAMRIEVIKD